MKAIVKYPVKHIDIMASLPEVEVREKIFDFNEKEIDFFTAGYEKACEDKKFNCQDSIRVRILDN